MILSRDHGAVADVAKGNQDWMYTVVNPGQPMVKPFLHDIEELLWPKGFTRDMWMIVDGARDQRAYTTVVSSYMNYSCLYAGDLAPALERAAPYLVQLEFESGETRRLIDRAWGHSWGVFLRCDDRMEKVRRHLRQFLRVRDRQGRFLVFRYYDPRVLRIYLPTCTTEELRTVFGPIESFYMEDENPAAVVQCRRDTAGKLAIKKAPVSV